MCSSLWRIGPAVKYQFRHFLSGVDSYEIRSDLLFCFFSLLSGLRTRLGLVHPRLGVKKSSDLREI